MNDKDERIFTMFMRKLREIKKSQAILFVLLAVSMVTTDIVMCLSSAVCTLICLVVTLSIGMLLCSSIE